MESNCKSSRKRSEILFDMLKAEDEANECKNSTTGQTVSLLNDVPDKFSEKSKLCNENKDCKESLKFLPSHCPIDNQDIVEKVAPNKFSSVTLEYKGLFKELDSQLSIEELCKSILRENKLTKISERILSLAVLCSSQLDEEECKSVFKVLNVASERFDSYALTFCQALLLYMLTKQKLSSDQFITLEENILSMAHSLIYLEDSYNVGFAEARIVLLGGECYLAASKLCEDIFTDQNILINSLDVKTICCAALKSLSNLRTVSIGLNKFSDNTLKYVISMIGISTQEIILENLIDTEEEEVISTSSYIVNQCLQVLEQILSVDPSSPCKTLDHEDFSLLRCLTKLLEWSVSSLFPEQVPENNLFKVQTATQSFYLSTLVSILKVFSILSFHPDQYDYFTNIKGSMEKIMICILKIYFQSKDNHFDILVLALEMMINFSFKCKKVFVLLCLKNFKISSSEEVLAIEALLKILNSSLEKINAIKSRSMTKVSENRGEGETQQESTTEEPDMDLVLKAADEDMELSTIVSFVGILLMLFIDTKKSFFEFVQERFSTERCAETVEVSKKFLQFAIITGGMPATGVLLLRAAIKKLSQLHQPSSSS